MLCNRKCNKYFRLSTSIMYWKIRFIMLCTENKRLSGPQSCTWIHLIGMQHILIMMMMLSTRLLSSFLKFCSVVAEKNWSRICLSQLEATLAILVFPMSPRNTNLVDDYETLLPVKFQRFQRSQKCLSQLKARAANLVFWSARNTQT